MGCSASTPSDAGGELQGNPEASAAKHLAAPSVDDALDPFSFGDNDGGEDGGGLEEELGGRGGLTGVAAAPSKRQSKPRTAPSAGGRGVASAGISIDLDLGGGGNGGGARNGGRRGGKRLGIITASGGGGGMSSAAAARSGGGGGTKAAGALHGVELGALHKVGGCTSRTQLNHSL
jgi:hypothetical protein